MKKISFLLLTIPLIFIASCSKTDTGKPVITLKGSNPHVVEWGSATKYAEPGAVVSDAVDGALDYTVDSTVNMYSAGQYTLTYTATDAGGNIATETRTVIVDAALYLQGFFTVKHYIGNPLVATYTDTLSLVADTNNAMEFKSFANYKNAKVHATMSGKTITIPQQVLTCGLPARNCTFSGTGSFTNDTAFTINYTIVDTTAQFTGHGEYIRN